MVAICGPTNGRPVRGSVGVLNQRRWECSIRPIEAVARGQRAGCRYFEHRPTATTSEVVQFPPPPVTSQAVIN
jgi:hypothetical protein